MRTVRTAIASVAVSVCLFAGVHPAAAQQPQMAQDVFKNVQVLRDIPVDEFMDTMGFFSSSLGLNCADCHTHESEGNWAHYADDTPLKNTARRMVQLVTAMNRSSFGGARAVTCWTCHRGDQAPKTIPNLAIQYGPPSEDANEAPVNGRATTAVDEIFDKYIQALGGSERVGALKSFVAAGTYSGYETDQQKMRVDIFAKAPAQRTTVVHMTIEGQTLDSVRTFDGQAGWVASPDKPIPLITLTGGNLEGARIDAMISFPAQLRRAFTQWKSGAATIEDRDVRVLEASNSGRPPVKLFFDAESG
ncbi:MAG TPA: photosynthetic reaction center cytochrome c subunit family protein, partial [Terriglobia bacterium]|nr:photosynthetic reaction center cytochrome c subunit family protein [Terriglobia bacterium]